MRHALRPGVPIAFAIASLTCIACAGSQAQGHFEAVVRPIRAQDDGRHVAGPSSAVEPGGVIHFGGGWCREQPWAGDGRGLLCGGEGETRLITGVRPSELVETGFSSARAEIVVQRGTARVHVSLTSTPHGDTWHLYARDGSGAWSDEVRAPPALDPVTRRIPINALGGVECEAEIGGDLIAIEYPEWPRDAGNGVRSALSCHAEGLSIQVMAIAGHYLGAHPAEQATTTVEVSYGGQERSVALLWRP